MNGEKLLSRLRTGWGKYKYIWLLCLAGIGLLLLPVERDSADARTADEQTAKGAEFSVGWTDLERRMEQALAQIEGAGEVRVVLTLKEGPRQVLAQEGKVGESSHETTTVLLNQGSGYQTAVKLQELAPEYQGALVVAQGADDPAIRLAISQAVSALTGLGTDKITICKGK